MSAKRTKATKLLSVRASVILTLALHAAISSGVLAYIEGASLSAVVMAACAGWAAAVVLFDALIDNH
jgi:hypothetical protein